MSDLRRASIKLAASMPKGSPERRALLAALSEDDNAKVSDSGEKLVELARNIQKFGKRGLERQVVVNIKATLVALSDLLTVMGREPVAQQLKSADKKLTL